MIACTTELAAHMQHCAQWWHAALGQCTRTQASAAYSPLLTTTYYSGVGWRDAPDGLLPEADMSEADWAQLRAFRTLVAQQVGLMLPGYHPI